MIDNLAWRIARRYLFAKKSTNAINIISIISIFGIMVGSAALVLVMSVLNGFEGVIAEFYGKFNPDIKISPHEGKVFVLDSSKMQALKNIQGVESVSATLEETALLEYKKTQAIAVIKGVDDHFSTVTQVDSSVREGEYLLRSQDSIGNFALVGIAMAVQLGMRIEEGEGFSSLGLMTIYMAKRESKSFSMNGMNKPFRSAKVFPSGIFEIQPDFDGYVIIHIDVARELLGYQNNELSAVEIKIKQGSATKSIMKNIENVVGKEFKIKNRYQQEEAFFKITNLEKWISYLILSFILLIVMFNMIGTLWMLIIDKKKDIAILKSMGANDTQIRNIFLYQGLLLSLLGMAIGFLLAIILCVAQQKYGFIRLQGNGEFLVSTYPVDMNWTDFIVVFFTVLFIGALASWIPAIGASRMSTLVRTE